MTCIIGLVENKKIYLGSDSLTGSDREVCISGSSKVFKIDDFVIGTSGYWSSNITSRYKFKPPTNHLSDDLEYMFTVFAPKLKKLLRTQKCIEEDEFEQVLVGYKNKLYTFETTSQRCYVLSHQDGIAAIGSGQDFAIGAMHALKNLQPKQRILKSLEVTQQLNRDVRPPFHILEM